jgi:GNAT superfamily N-acetyltransferase
MKARHGRNGVQSQNGNGVAEDRRPAVLTVRPALAGDRVPLQFFCDTLLRRDYFLRRGQLAELLSDECHEVYVAELDTVLVGLAIVTGGSRLVNVLVHPAYRGLGVGRVLVAQSGACEVRAQVAGSAGDSRPFYEALGFARTGRFNAKGNIEVLCRPGPARRGANGCALTARRRRN